MIQIYKNTLPGNTEIHIPPERDRNLSFQLMEGCTLGCSSTQDAIVASEGGGTRIPRYKVNPPKQGLFRSKQGSFGFQVHTLCFRIFLFNQKQHLLKKH